MCFPLTMNISLQFQTLHTISCSKPTKNKPKRHRIPPLPSLKSPPTPLLIPPKPQTKLDALKTVVYDVESSIKAGIKIDTQTYASLLETCHNLNAIEYGIRVHKLIPHNLLRKNVGISSKLVRLYAFHGCVEDAHKVFDEMSEKGDSAFPWNSLIYGYAEAGLFEDALALYFQMVEDGVDPDRFTFPRVLKACGGIGLVYVGEEIHRHAVRFGFGSDVFVLNGLVDMYAKCGDIVKARKVFDKIVHKDLVSWNVMITGYVRHELLSDALDVLRGMIPDGYEPDEITISTILASGLSLRLVAQIHGWILRNGLEWNLSIANSLIVVYSNNGRLDSSRRLFDQMPERDLISWNSIISAHCKHPDALAYFERMVSCNTMPDAVTFVSLLSACAHLGMVNDGEKLFSVMIDKYRINPVMEHYACMVNLYGRAGFIDKAYEIILDRMEFEAGPTVWGALLYACYLHGNVDMGEIAAENLFELEPDNEHNFELLMKVYGKAGRLEDVERVRAMMLERGLEL